jgi:two-component system response regulator CpxR
VIISMPKILIADDSRVQVHLFSTCLTDKGFEVIVAVDALQAWMKALREAPNAIVLDINMPGGSGLAILRRLKHLAKTQHIPVVVVSGSDEPELKKEITSLGAEAFLQKPVDLEQLSNILLQLLRPPGSVVTEPKATHT